MKKYLVNCFCLFVALVVAESHPPLAEYRRQSRSWALNIMLAWLGVHKVKELEGAGAGGYRSMANRCLNTAASG